jgi:hypothetical protein
VDDIDNWEDIPHYELCDEVIRLRAERDDLQVLLRGRTAEFQAEIERLRAVERRSHDLWWLAYHTGPVTLTVQGSHEMHRTVTVDGRSYNYDDPADVAFLETRREQ